MRSEPGKRRAGGPARTPSERSLVDENPFACLRELGTDEWRPPAVLRGGGGRQFERTAREWHEYARRHRRPIDRGGGGARPEPFDTASELRTLIYDYVDCEFRDVSVPVPKCSVAPAFGRDALWDRISLSRLRFKHDRRVYVRVRRRDGRARPLLTWAVPPAGPYRDDHASRQASYNDDGPLHGGGLRVNLEALLRHGAPADEVAKVARGYEVALHTQPRRYHGRNYGGALDHPDKIEEETARMVESGFVEGPLLYTPHIVQGLGGVWKEEKQKWRTIVNGTSSGVNPASLPLGADYDMLADVLGPLRPGMRMSGFDLTDAFLNWPYTQEDSDLWGFQTASGYYRYRFMAFGGCQSPSVQQRWARIVKSIVNEHGLKHCHGRAADYKTFACTGAYLDDFAMQHAAHLTEAECLEQFESVLTLLRELGLVFKQSKNVYPSTSALYVGFVIDSVAQTVNITEERARALAAEISALRQAAPAGTPVGRRTLAALIGKLQWVVQVVPHGQRLLLELYASRDAFCDESVRTRGLRAQWADGVTVALSAAADTELGDWLKRLAAMPGTPIYLTDLGMPSGFWKGRIPETDEELDREGNLGQSGEDVTVITGDASGRASGGWYLDRRMVHLFPPEECAPVRSSNYRELKTVLLMLQRWGAELRGRRVLVRTDNTTTACAVNRGFAKAEGLAEVAEAIRQLTSELQISLAARHVPGLKNGLADRLSRILHTVEEPDRGDRRFRRDEFLRIQRAAGARFEVDACADVEGHNAHCRQFYSAADSALEHDWAGRLTWCHPDWELLPDLLGHFLREYAREPMTTAGVFVVPVWPGAKWWRRLRGFEVLDVYAEGSSLCTAPISVQTDSVQPGPVPREAAGGSPWLTAVLRYGHRAGAAAGAQRQPLPGGRGRPAPGGRAAVAGDELGVRQPVLSGDGAADEGLLRGLQPRLVRRLRRAHH